MKTNEQSMQEAEQMDKATYKLASRDAAWAFYRACSDAKVPAGYPSLRSPDKAREPEARTVVIGIRTWMDREAADKLADGAPCVSYSFAGSDDEEVYS